MYELVDIMRERLKNKALCVLGYGHIGDGNNVQCINMYNALMCVVHVLFMCVGNLHFNAVGGSHSKELLGLIEPFIFEWTGRLIHSSWCLLNSSS